MKCHFNTGFGTSVPVVILSVACLWNQVKTGDIVGVLHFMYVLIQANEIATVSIFIFPLKCLNTLSFTAS
jgi:hypothetical protein